MLALEGGDQQYSSAHAGGAVQNKDQTGKQSDAQSHVAH